MTDYYHDEATNTVYAVEEPTIFEVRKPKSYSNPHPKVDYYSISCKTTVINTESGEVQNNFTDEEYNGRRYTRRQALAAFTESFAAPGKKIDRDQYLRLVEKH